MSIQSLLNNSVIRSSVIPTSVPVGLVVSDQYNVAVFSSSVPAISANNSTINGNVVNLAFRVMVPTFATSNLPALLLQLGDNEPNELAQGIWTITKEASLGWGIVQVATDGAVSLQNTNGFDLQGLPADIDVNLTYVI